ncbi:UNVERIFIED_ORG: hypothetical protein ABIC54_001618 [Burkholderia sp. 1263]
MFEAFKIGVRLSLVNQVSHGLSAMAKDFNKAEGAVDSLRSKIARMSTGTKLMFGGALAVGIGASMAMTLRPALNEARKMQGAMTEFKNFGMSDAQNNEAFEFAKHMDIAGSSYVENLKKMTEAQGAFRESGLKGSEALAGAKLAAPMLARVAAIGKASGHEMTEADDKAFIRAIEMSGGLHDAATFNSRADAIFKLVGSSGGMVKYEDVRAFYARGGVSAKSMTEEALMKFEPIIGEMKGTSAGTALMTSFNRLNGIVKLPNQIVHELVNAGLWNGKNIQWNSQGGVKNIKSEGLLTGASLLQSDPVEWERKYLEPMYAKMGLVIQRQKDVENARLFGRTGGAEFSLIQQQAQTIARSPEAIRKRLGIGDTAANKNKKFDGQLNIASAAWRNVLNNVGTAILPNATAGLTTLSGILTKLADFARDNPLFVSVIAQGAAVAAAGLLIVGSISLIVGGLSMMSDGLAVVRIASVLLLRTLALNPIGLILTGIAAVAIYAWQHWDTIGPKLKAAWASITDGSITFTDRVGQLWRNFKHFVGLDDSAPPGTTGKGAPNTAPHGSTVGGSGFVRPRATTAQPIHTQVNLDGKQIATAVSNHVADGVMSAHGPGGFNFGLGQATAGQGYD